MFSKTWRVHSIFTNIKLNKKVRKLLSKKTRMKLPLAHSVTHLGNKRLQIIYDSFNFIINRFNNSIRLVANRKNGVER